MIASPLLFVSFIVFYINILNFSPLPLSQNQSKPIFYNISYSHMQVTVAQQRDFTSTDHVLKRFTRDPDTGSIYVGAVNRLYILNSDLNLIEEVTTGRGTVPGGLVLYSCLRF